MLAKYISIHSLSITQTCKHIHSNTYVGGLLVNSASFQMDTVYGLDFIVWKSSSYHWSGNLERSSRTTIGIVRQYITFRTLINNQPTMYKTGNTFSPQRNQLTNDTLINDHDIQILSKTSRYTKDITAFCKMSRPITFQVQRQAATDQGFTTNT